MPAESHLFLLAIALAPASPALAGPSATITSTAATSWLDALTVHGDFRYRFEGDWRSRQDDGTYRTDRFRMRIRARLGFRYTLSKYLHVSARLRTGVPSNMQSPHINVGYNSFTQLPINLGRAFVGGEVANLWWWAGKNSYPLWKQNELFWDDDVNPEGLALGAVFGTKALQIRPTVAYFVAVHEQVLAFPDGRIGMGQVAAHLEFGEHLGVDAAVAYIQADDIFAVPPHLTETPGPRSDYKFVISGLRAKVKDVLPMPMTVGLDHAINVQDYADDPAIPAHYKSQKTGVVATLTIGALDHPGDWLVAYTYARKEKLSVIDYLAEDDWVRWGNIDRNRNTNYQGHELRAAYALWPKVNLMLRYYDVVALVPRIENQADAVTETGRRLRLDLNAGF